MQYKMNEIVEIVGITRKTLKNWLGRHVPEPKRAQNGYRVFSEDDLRQIMAYKQKLVATTNYHLGALK
ncbi:MAG: MerR family transcriptional regulator [Blastocatellia bacterium]|nr:MerR family transcriptional regulator [Blastocatellia bacterium]